MKTNGDEVETAGDDVESENGTIVFEFTMRLKGGRWAKYQLVWLPDNRKFAVDRTTDGVPEVHRFVQGNWHDGVGCFCRMVSSRCASYGENGDFVLCPCPKQGRVPSLDEAVPPPAGQSAWPK